MNASTRDQKILLEIAELDRRIATHEHAAANPPHRERVAELVAQRSVENRVLAEKASARDEVKTELARVEGDIALALARIQRDEERLATAGAKDAQALENEISSLQLRVSGLEDNQLELMERSESVEQDYAVQQALLATINDEGRLLSEAAKTLVAEAKSAANALQAQRAERAGGVNTALVEMYDRLRVRNAGVAVLRGSSCEGCHILLPASDVRRMREQPADVVVTCPECGCILVRDESAA